MWEPFQEISRTTYFLNRIEETSISWNNSHLAARTDKGILFYELSKNQKCMSKKFELIESFIKTPRSSPCSDLLKKWDKSQLKNRDFAELILDTAFWPHSDLLTRNMTTIVSFEWSPRNILPNDECILAIVNSIGNVNLFVHGRHKWICVLDLSRLVQEQFSEISQKNLRQFEDVKLTVFNLESCSICWSPTFPDGTSYLVTGQKSGVLLFWTIQCADGIITAKCCGKFDNSFEEAVTLLWIPKSDTHFTIISTNILGQVFAYECQINNNVIVLNKIHLIWEHQDKMLVYHLKYEIIDDQLLLIFNKHRHLVMQLVDNDFKIVSQTVNNLNDFRITSIVKGDNNIFYTSTVNSKLYQIKYLVEKDILKVDFELIKMKDISESSELYGVGFSENKAICALSVIDRRILHKKERLTMEIIFLNLLPSNSDLDIIINNPTKRIISYWDCITVLCYKIVKAKALPQRDYAHFLNDLYKLKIYLIILTMYKWLESSAKIQRISLPKQSIEEIKDKILLEQAKTNVVKVYTEHSSNNPLSDIEKESFMGSQKFIEFYCKKYKINQSEIIAPNMLKLSFDKRYYCCQNCDEEIIDISCKNGHLNMFCMLTFTPIESLDYLMCNNCDTIARFELKSYNPMCLFCDSYLSDSYLPV